MAFALILDGYVDEPACFGVPPYISPYVRYLAGVFMDWGMEVSYFTCDEWRRSPRPDLLADSDVTVVVAGLTVPGRYRGGSPLTLKELREFSFLPRKGPLLLAGPIHNGYVLRGGRQAVEFDPGRVDCIASGDPEAVLDHYLRTKEWIPTLRRSYLQLKRWASLGSSIVYQHPDFPWIMAEMELSRGCDRIGSRCSFCTEGLGLPLEERPVSFVLDEVRSLVACGIRAFRLGRCSNILSYGGTATPLGRKPCPELLETLYSGIRSLCPVPLALHTDNVNPLTLTTFPNESLTAMERIVRYNTEGDGLSLGIENLDAKVKKLNGLKVDVQEALFAVRLINQVGAVRKTPRGMPSLLPGLNFLFGLAGEDRESLKVNTAFLNQLLEEGLLVRRINIRRAMVFPKTRLSMLLREFPSRLKEKDYQKWKKWVREEVDHEMLQRVAPQGTLIRKVRIEERCGGILFGRPLWSYPPRIGIAAEKDLGDILDVAICGHGKRSLSGVPYPLDPNTCSLKSLLFLPGIGLARAKRILRERPFENRKNLAEALDSSEIYEKLLPFLEEEIHAVNTGG